MVIGLASRNRSIVTTTATAGHGIMTKMGTAPTACSMAIAALAPRNNMIGRFACRHGTVVATDTTAGNRAMIQPNDRCPCAIRVTRIAISGTLYMSDRLTDREGAVMATLALPRRTAEHRIAVTAVTT